MLIVMGRTKLSDCISAMWKFVNWYCKCRIILQHTNLAHDLHWIFIYNFLLTNDVIVGEKNKQTCTHYTHRIIKKISHWFNHNNQVNGLTVNHTIENILYSNERNKKKISSFSRFREINARARDNNNVK